MPPLPDARLKFSWAERHIVDLVLEIDKFCTGSPQPYTLGFKPHNVPQIEHITIFVKSLRKLPDKIPLMIGDAVHNLRATLDYIAWGMVIANRELPSTATSFPIGDPSKIYAPSFGAGPMKGMSAKAQKIVRSEQPGETNDPALWHLHRLDIADKHRLLVTAQLGSEAWSVNAFGSGLPIFFDQNAVEIMEGHEIAHIPRTTYERQQQEDFKLVLDIAFGQSEVVGRKNVITVLNHMANTVDRILRRFETL